MKRVFFLILVIGGISLLASPSNALQLINETFDPPADVILNANSGIKSTTDYYKWIDFPSADPTKNRWDIGLAGTNYFAQHVYQGDDSTNILMYGIDANSLLPGTEITLSFDYLATRRARAYIVGMDIDYHYLDNNAPWLDGETATSGGWDVQWLGTDGVVLADYALDSVIGDLNDQSTWGAFTSSSLTWTGSGMGYDTRTSSDETFDFDTLAIAFVMGGTDGNRAIDNVRLEATAPVPEPATLLLISSGLIGLAGFKRKFGKK